MKKWIFPLVLIIVDLIFAILFMTPSIDDCGIRKNFKKK